MDSVNRTIEALTRESFARFGSVVQFPQHGGRWINNETALRFDDVAHLCVGREGGRAQLSLFRVEPLRLPLRCERLERHPLSTQLFMPLGRAAFIVIVALGVDAPDPDTLRAFRTDGTQGVNYAPGTWHHPVVALDTTTDFLVISRASAIADDFEEKAFPGNVAFELV